jgi:large subunit ribosomal protein L24
MLVDPETGELTRVGVRRDEDGRQVRYSKKSGQDID